MLRFRWNAIVLALALSSAQAAIAPAAPRIGDIPPQLLGKDRGGDPVDLAQLRGKVVVVTFWASWCGYCRKELPALNAMQSAAGPDYFRVVAVNVQDDNDHYRDMMRKMPGYALTFARDRSGTIAESYGVSSYPNLWIIDPQGKVAARYVGYGEGSFKEIVDKISQVVQAEVERLHSTPASTAAASG